MGLDMNIYRERRVSTNKQEREDAEKKGLKVPYRKTVIEEAEVAYFRKANAIHKYFVDTFADGVDECQRIDIGGITGLEELKNLCDDVLKHCKIVKGIINDGNGCFIRPKEEAVPIMKKDGNAFVGDGWKQASKLAVGDYVDNENHIGRITSVEDNGDTILFDCVYERVGDIIENEEYADINLPTQAGFFFGSTDYDEYYLADLKNCSEQLGRIIDEHYALIESGADEYDINYYYQASW